MEEHKLRLVIVGHVDHGKSTFIGRLLYDTGSLGPDKIEEIRKKSNQPGTEIEFAYFLDHLEEERVQGITIDTTQVFFKTQKREYVIIDAPGHKEFVRNMITGASQADAGILIIDATEGVAEQTRRHAYILSLLGLKRVMIMVNKMDKVDFKEAVFTKVKQATDNFLSAIGIKPSFYIPISALNGDNLVHSSVKTPWYGGKPFVKILDGLDEGIDTHKGYLIFPVQDIFRYADKRSILGRVERGVIRKGQSVKVASGNQIAKIKAIERYPLEVDSAAAGQSLSLILEDSLFVERGDIICDVEHAPKVIDSFTASVFWLAGKEFSKKDKLIFRCSTQETGCKIEEIKRKINSSTLEVIEEHAEVLRELEVGKVIIKTKRPVVVEPFADSPELGRFVLVRGEHICAGGIITL